MNHDQQIDFKIEENNLNNIISSSKREEDILKNLFLGNFN